MSPDKKDFPGYPGLQKISDDKYGIPEQNIIDYLRMLDSLPKTDNEWKKKNSKKQKKTTKKPMSILKKPSNNHGKKTVRFNTLQLTQIIFSNKEDEQQTRTQQYLRYLGLAMLGIAFAAGTLSVVGHAGLASAVLAPGVGALSVTDLTALIAIGVFAAIRITRSIYEYTHDSEETPRPIANL